MWFFSANAASRPGSVSATATTSAVPLFVGPLDAGLGDGASPDYAELQHGELLPP